MANTKIAYREVRFLIEEEQTTCYVRIDAWDDVPIGVQGWHMKAFPASVPVSQIITEYVSDSVMWPQQAPPQN